MRLLIRSFIDPLSIGLFIFSGNNLIALDLGNKSGLGRLVSL